MKRLAVSVMLFVALIAAGRVQAGLPESTLAAMITPPMQLGTRDPGLPVWTLLDGGGAPAGYVFETRDLAPIAGFSGTPLNMLVAIDKGGTFLDVRVLEQNEPVFVDGLGPEPLYDFVRQYRGLTLGRAIKVGSARDRGRDGSANTWIDGVTKATATVRIVNESVLAAATIVARQHLAGLAPRTAGRPRTDIFRPMGWDQMVAGGLIHHLRVSRAEVERAFSGAATESGDQAEIDVWVADLGLPMVARNLLSEDTLRKMTRHVDSWEEPILVLSDGHFSISGEDFVRNSVPDRLSVSQDGFPVGVRDADVEIELLPGLPRLAEALVLRLDTRAGFDPASPWNLGVRVVRRSNPLDLDGNARTFNIVIHSPADLFVFPRVEAPAPPWLASWSGRVGEIAMLLGCLGALTTLLVFHRRWRLGPRRLVAVRLAFLAVTLGFIGWWAQGQLSIVTVAALVKSVQGGGIGFLLYDPVSLILWLYVLSTLLIWGRGPFCGWLCPFGALQEFVGEAARLLRLPQVPMPGLLHRRLVWVKYGVLAAVVAAATTSVTLTDRLVEVEPFKTAITLGFVRSWPFVAYALGLLAVGLVIYKGFCRYLCPLGAGLALSARLRRFSWVERRRDCGAPCRLCEARCRYRAIGRDGAVDYAECVQCLECVAIHDDPGRCVPLILANRRAREGRDG